MTLELADQTGRRVRTLIDGLRAGGAQRIDWDGRDYKAWQVTSGRGSRDAFATTSVSVVIRDVSMAVDIPVSPLALYTPRGFSVSPMLAERGMAGRSEAIR